MLRLMCVLATSMVVAAFLDDSDLVQSRLEALEAKYNALSAQMRECRCGGVTSRPSFMASLSTDLDHYTKDQPIIFDSVEVNVGHGYNNVHGTFTAPVPGTYSFTATLTAKPQHHFYVAMVKNNPANDIAYFFSENLPVYSQDSNTVLTHLNAGEEVGMVCLADSSIHGGSGFNNGTVHSHWSGFLVSDD